MREYLSFGWIGNGNRVKMKKNSEVTQLTNVIKQVLIGHTRYEGINARNLINYNGKIIYILSMKSDGSMWGPYPFITELIEKKEFHLLLAKGDITNDTDDVSGEFRVLNQEECKRIFNDANGSFSLTLNERERGGEYYSLPLTLVNRADVDGISFSRFDELKEKLIEKLG